MTAIVVLGMHRSGTSCLAGMLAAGGLASAGAAVRNWDNARGHHEMLDLVRLNEAVLATSGGHWLAAPAEVRWTDEQATARERLLAARVDGRPALLKDPRTLLVWPFWRATQAPLRAVGIVRHPLAVARSLESWRGLPLADGIALWTAHNRVLADEAARHGTPIVDFDRPCDEVIAAVLAFCATLGARCDAAALAAAHEEALVHHDGGEASEIAGLGEALALHRRLGGGRTEERARFPRAALSVFTGALAEGDVGAALAAARQALARVRDPTAVLVPVIAGLVRRRAYREAQGLVAEHAAALPADFAALLTGKVLLAAGEPERAVAHLAVACAAPAPLYQAQHLLAQALRQAGRDAEARAALTRAAAAALYPHGPLSTLAEWRWRDGGRRAALAEMGQAIDAAPVHRRGRMRCRRAEWLLALGEAAAAVAELEVAVAEDPAYPRSQALLAAMRATATHSS